MGGSGRRLMLDSRSGRGDHHSFFFGTCSFVFKSIFQK